MNWVDRHPWPQAKHEAYAIQDDRVSKIDIAGNTVEPVTIAAVEATYGKDAAIVYAAAVVFTFPALEEIERKYAHADAAFPYIPGLFYFREGPVLVAALEELETEPDLIMVSGHGIAHPRRCGIASHIGLDFDRPTIGCARRLLVGNHRPLDDAKGTSQSLIYHNDEIGLAYRSRDRVKPIFISPGHRCNLAFTRDIIVRCLRDYRLPEPIRTAHRLANKHKRFMEKPGGARRRTGTTD